MNSKATGSWLERVATRRYSLLVALVIIVVALAGALLIGLFPLIALALAGVVIVASSTLLRRYRRRRRVDAAPISAVVGVYGLVVVGVLLLIQLVPFGRAHTNPAVTAEPAWATMRTRELMVDACYGCHSNEVEWPWYSNVAPMSWAITAHVDQARDEVNYSEWDANDDEGDETIEVILERSMPPDYFTRFGLHPEAKLTAAEVAELVAGLRATPGMGDDEDEDRNDEDEEDREDPEDPEDPEDREDD